MYLENNWQLRRPQHFGETSPAQWIAFVLTDSCDLLGIGAIAVDMSNAIARCSFRQTNYRSRTTNDLPMCSSPAGRSRERPATHLF
jgi:3-dehydroquinate dehydratase